MTIAPLDLILLLGAVQGFILAVLLWTNTKGSRLSNRLLAMLIGLLALMSFAVGIPIANRYVSLFLDLAPLYMVMPIGPLILFYTRSLLDPSFSLGQSERVQFLPIVLDWGAPLIIWVFFAGFLLGLWPRQDGPSWGHAMNEYNTYVDIPRWISITVYLFITRKRLQQYTVAGKSSPVEQQQLKLRWVRQFVHGKSSPVEQQQLKLRWVMQFVHVFLIFQVIWFVHLVPYLIPEFRNALLDRFGWYPVYIPIALLIYWLGFKGYLHTRTNTLTSQTPKPASPELPNETVRQVVHSLTNAMTNERLFLDPELTVEKVGQHTRLAPKIISAILNQHVGKNFNGFINEYRVEEVKGRLTNPAYGHLTLTGIAFDAGFNSQATFQRAFKQQTGLSPGEYVAQLKKNTTQIRI
jgi:AraC-like DNA-binding protein